MFDSNRDQVKYFQDLLESEALQLRDSVKRLRWSTYTLKISILFLSGVSTVLLGLDESTINPKVAKNFALVIGTIVTILSGLLAMWHLDKYWIRKRILCDRLENLLEEFNFYMHSVDKKSLESLFRKYYSIQRYQDVYWEGAYEDAGRSSADKKNESEGK